MSANKDAVRSRRDAAFSAKLDIEPDDKIVTMVGRGDGMYAITQKKIIRLNLPDDLDPAMEHENAPVTQSIVAEQGSRNRIVARTILQAEDFAAFFAEDRKRRIRDVAWEVMHSLLSLDGIIEGFRKSIETTCSEIEPRIEAFISGTAPPPLPIISTLETDFRSAVLIANHSLKQRLSAV